MPARRKVKGFGAVVLLPGATATSARDGEPDTRRSGVVKAPRGMPESNRVAGAPPAPAAGLNADRRRPLVY